jgi:hypothetical protein
MLKTLKRVIVFVTIAAGVAAVIDQLMRPAESRTWHGTVFGVPYDLRPPTVERLQRSWWNPEDPRLFTPRSFGIGWDINLHRALNLIASFKQGQEPAE